MPTFPLARAARATDLGGLGTPHGQQPFQIVLLALHQDGTKQGRRCSHSTWSLDDLWVAFPLVWPVGLASPVFRWAFWTNGRTHVTMISQFGEVVRHSGLCEFHSCAVCREVSHQWHNVGGKGAKCPGRREVPTVSEVFLQYSAFTPKRP